ncbi:dNTP triphosphohydrolase [candidate division KSB1 bacterium]|nr:dNTP triphosphohydrolase [candidate division KSB1 bacterium]RQW10459.1 MAG: dNTP triphosphohydrolase [candidate division KSB1 bacterium]
MNIYQIRDRRSLERIEADLLSPFAAKSADGGATRLSPEEEHPYRTSFQRDRDRIIHSRAFRRLKHKRQVFLITYGDHYRTRLTHTVEVSQLSRTMAKALGLNEDLAEAIGLGHDLGHTPFGHIGEVALDRILQGKDTLEGTVDIGDVGGFKHNYQSVRIVDLNEKKYDFDGLNLSAAVREGILKHTSLRRGQINFPDFRTDGLFYDLDHATTLEGQIVAICDEIAQRTHDLEDGIRAGYVTLAQVRRLPIIRLVEQTCDIEVGRLDDDFVYRNRLVRKLVNFLVTDVLQQTIRTMKAFYAQAKRYSHFDARLVWFSDAIDPLQEELDRFIMAEIIARAAEKRSDDAAMATIRSLFRHYYTYPNLLPVYRLEKCTTSAQRRVIYSGEHDHPEMKAALTQNPLFPRAISDYVAGMTDHFAERAMVELSHLSPTELAQQRADIETVGL